LPREVDLQRHLVNAAQAEEAAATAAAEENKIEPKMFEFGGADDYQLKQAINFLEGRPVKKTDPTLALNADKANEAAKAGKSGTPEKLVPPASKTAPAAEKKSPVNPNEGQFERYRITPDGLIKAQ